MRGERIVVQVLEKTLNPGEDGSGSRILVITIGGCKIGNIWELLVLKMEIQMQ